MVPTKTLAPRAMGDFFLDSIISIYDLFSFSGPPPSVLASLSCSPLLGARPSSELFQQLYRDPSRGSSYFLLGHLLEVLDDVELIHAMRVTLHLVLLYVREPLRPNHRLLLHNQLEFP